MGVARACLCRDAGGYKSHRAHPAGFIRLDGAFGESAVRWSGGPQNLSWVRVVMGE